MDIFYWTYFLKFSNIKKNSKKNFHQNKWSINSLTINLKKKKKSCLCFSNSHAKKFIIFIFLTKYGVRLDIGYLAENWKYYSKIIFKCMNSAVRPIFNEKVVEKWGL